MEVVKNDQSNSNKCIQIGNDTEKLVADEKYCDIASIRVPETLTDLISELNKIFALDRVNIEYVQTLMTMYKSNPKEWRTFAKFDEHRYTRNLVDEGNGKFNLMLLCWNENQGSSIHAHANSHCFMKVLEGSVKEEIYDWPSQHQDLSSEPGHHGLECRKISTFNTNEVTYISDVQDKGQVIKRKLTQDELVTSSRVGVSDHWVEMDVFQLNHHTCSLGDLIVEPNLKKSKFEHNNKNDSIGLHRVENPSHTEKAVTLHLYSPPFQECYCFDKMTGHRTVSKMTFWSKLGKRTPFGSDCGSSAAENN